MNSLLEKIESKRSKIGIIGLGYVGLPLALAFCEKKFTVVGLDLDEKKIDCINIGKSYIQHICSNDVFKCHKSGLLTATTNMNEIADLDIVIICVPTPLNSSREPDLSFLKAAINSIVPNLHSGMMICLTSTTYPGTTNELIVPMLESEGYVVGKDIFVVYAPEREDPGNQNYTVTTVPKVVGGVTSSCLEVGSLIFKSIINTVVPVSSTETAEMCKLVENIHRSVNIGLVNELKPIARALEIDIFEVIKAAATKPYGFTPYFPGPGLGGHCIPVDPFYLSWKAKTIGINPKFIELSADVNHEMLTYVVTNTIKALNEIGLSLSRSKILVLGLAYKKNIDDTRESPSIPIVNQLISYGAYVDYSDRYSNYNFNVKDDQHAPINNANYKDYIASDFYNAILILTDHDYFDFEFILKKAPVIIDSRGRFPMKTPKVYQT